MARGRTSLVKFAALYSFTRILDHFDDFCEFGELVIQDLISTKALTQCKGKSGTSPFLFDMRSISSR